MLCWEVMTVNLTQLTIMLEESFNEKYIFIIHWCKKTLPTVGDTVP